MSSFIKKLESQIHSEPAENSTSNVNFDAAFPTLPTDWKPKDSPSWKPVTKQMTHTDRFVISSDKLVLKTNQAKQTFGNVSVVCKNVMKKFNTKIEYSINQKSQATTFLVSGSVDNVIESKKALLDSLTEKITDSIVIPSSVRSSLLGKNGSVLKAITEKTNTKIEVPQYKEEDGKDGEICVTINGSAFAIEAAKAEIDRIVTEKTSHYSRRVAAERSFHQLIAGYNRETVNDLEKEYSVSIHIPPFDYNSNQNRNLDEIVVVGDRTSVIRCEAQILKLYEDLRESTNTVEVNIPKLKHRFVIGPKATLLQEVFKQTSCVVQVPILSNPSETVIIRGPQEKISNALQIVLANANSVFLNELDISPVAGKDAVHFARYINLKQKPALKEIETEFACSIFRKGETSTFEIQGKTKQLFDKAIAKFKSLCEQICAKHYLTFIEIDIALHRHLVGKGGQNLPKLMARPEFNSRIVDIVVPSISEDSSRIMLVLTKPTKKEVEENFIKSIEDVLREEATRVAGLVTQTMNVDRKYHGRLIGANGSSLAELVEPFGDSVNVKFPSSDSSNKSEIIVKGSESSVQAVISKIEGLVSEWKKLDSIIGFSETLQVPSGYGQKLVGTPREVGIIFNSIKEMHKEKALKFLATEKFIEEKIEEGKVIHLSFEIKEGEKNDVISIKGPKSLVSFAKNLLEKRLAHLQSLTDIYLNLFESIGVEAKKVILDYSDEQKQSFIKHLIGREGKQINRIAGEHNSTVHFSNFDEDSEVGSIHIHGDKQGAEKLKKFLIDLVNEKILNSHVESLVIPKSCVSRIIGRGGATLNNIVQTNNVRIQFGEDVGENSVLCTISGATSNCASAKQAVLKIVGDFVNISERKVAIPVQIHRSIIGPSGSVIQEFVEKYGGAEKIRVTLPKGGARDLNAITIVGDSSVLESAAQDLVALAVRVINGNDSKSKFTGLVHPSGKGVFSKTLTISKSETANVLGKNYDTVIPLMRKYGVTIWIYDSNETKQVEITICSNSSGHQAVDSCEKDLWARKRQSVEVTLPIELCEILQAGDDSSEAMRVSLKGSFQRGTINDCHVNLTEKVLSGEDPIIRITGAADKLHVAQILLQERLGYLSESRFYSEIFVPLKMKGLVIGAKGKTFEKIKSESGITQIDFAPNDTLLRLRGSSREKVDRARELVLQIIQVELPAPVTPVQATIEQPNDTKDIPGLNTRKGQSRPKIASSVSTPERNVKAAAPVVNEAAPIQNGWTSIPVRGKQTVDAPIEERESQVGIVGLSESKKKKRNKKNKSKTAQMADSEEPLENGVVATAEKEIAKPISPPTVVPQVISPKIAESASVVVEDIQQGPAPEEEWQSVNPGRKSFKIPTAKPPVISQVSSISLSSNNLELLALEDNDESKPKKKKKKNKNKKKDSEPAPEL